MMEAKKSLGIMGGTFDPIHYGHLVTAECVRYQFRLEKVIFVPTGRPPHKDRKVTDPYDRLAMTRLAVASNPHFEVSDIEVRKKRISYTIDTIEKMKEFYPFSRLYFITGADAVLEILTWRNIEKLLSMCNFIAATRPGYNLQNLEDKLKGLPDHFLRRIFSIVVPALAISSTDIRKRVRECRPIKYLLPEAVERYIKEHGLYKSTNVRTNRRTKDESNVINTD